tara:strand:+ start:60 stop:1889 length:1830 start_codon:yes stop_codon:yes gene_type:complete
MDTKRFIKLKELAESIQAGKHYASKEYLGKGGIRVIKPRNISNGILTESVNDYFISHENNFNNAIEIGDILVSLIGPEFNSCVIESLSQPAVVNSHIAVIKSENNHYLNAFFNSKTGLLTFKKEALKHSTGTVINRLSIKALSNINIPYFPIPDLNSFVMFSKNANIYESEIANSLVIKLESLGWEVIREYKINHSRHRLDLALLNDGELETFIEIKRNSRNLLAHIPIRLESQLNTYLTSTNCSYALCFFDGRLLKFENGQFIPLKDFPSPSPRVRVRRQLVEKSNNENELTSNDIIHTDYLFFQEILQENLALKQKVESLESKDKVLKQMQSDIQVIKATTSRTEEKIDSLLKILTQLSNDFISIKKSTALTDEKLLKLTIELEENLKLVKENNFSSIAKYEKVLEKIFAFEWDKFETLSKSFLPTAEFLFDELSKFEHPDLSPFILQYCRALENEILQKVFRNYVQNLKDRNVSIEKDFEWDISLNEKGKPINSNTFRFAKHLKKCLSVERQKWFFELGSMYTYLKYLTGKTISKSPLLQDLRTFLFKYFEEHVLETEFLLRIEAVTIEFRNKAAHPNRINVEDAERGKKELRSILKDLLEMYKTT